MLVKEIFENLKRGRYANITWQSVNGEYTKISNGVVRYWGIRECKNGHTLVTMRVTKNKQLKVKVKYFHNGVEIDENEYYSHNEKVVIDEWFSKRLEDIVKVGA